MLKNNPKTGKKFYGLQTIDEKLNHLLKPIFQGSKKEFIIINNLVKNWHQIVGAKNAKFCTPKLVSFDKNKNGGKLTISVFNSAVGFFLENNSEIIIERIATLYGFKSINKIIIKQEPKNIQTAPSLLESPQINDNLLAPKIAQKISLTLNNIEDEELVRTLKQLAEDIFGKTNNN